MGLVCGDLRWFVVGVVCFSADVCGGVPALWVCGAVSCMAFVVASRFLLGVCGGVLFLGWHVWWRAMPCCCCLFPGFCGGGPCRADVACWGGWGPHTPCARQIGPHPPQPTPPSQHGSLRCVWERRQKRQGLCGCSLRRLPAFSFSRVTPHSGASAHGFARARGEPSDNLCSQCAEDGSPLEWAQSAAAPPQPGRPNTKTPHPTRPTTLLKTSDRMAHTAFEY